MQGPLPFELAQRQSVPLTDHVVQSDVEDVRVVGRDLHDSDLTRERVEQLDDPPPPSLTRTIRPVSPIGVIVFERHLPRMKEAIFADKAIFRSDRPMCPQTRGTVGKTKPSGFRQQVLAEPPETLGRVVVGGVRVDAPIAPGR